MGNSSYSHSSRSSRTALYKSGSFEDTFTQQRKREVHNTMSPKTALIREARDSENHPQSLPIIFGMDITGSMEDIPKHMIKDGLPHLISKLQEKGVNDAAIMFMGLGDSRCDQGPVQVGQFESGDAELDMFLTRTWIEGNGGGNGGESYAWAWYFAAKRCVTDAWEKRKQKGFIFTMGDDNCHDITKREFTEVLGINQETMSKEELYKQASERWNVYHINMKGRQVSGDDFRTFMGENLLEVENETEIPSLIAKIITSHINPSGVKSDVVIKEAAKKTPEEDIKITL